MESSIELSEKEKGLQYAMYEITSSYFKDSKESVKVASTYREGAIKTSFMCLKKDMQAHFEDNVIYYLERFVLPELSEDMLSDHVQMTFVQYKKNADTVVGVVFDAYFWKLELLAEFERGNFELTHNITIMEEDE